MKLPNNTTEKEFIDIVNNIADKLIYRFQFGYFTKEDIRQECFIEAIGGLERYNETLPLANFLWCHIKNRLCNLKRKRYIRLDKPCFNCPLAAYIPDKDACKIYKDKNDCKLYTTWTEKNIVKQNLMHPISIGNVNDESESFMLTADNMLDQISNDEIINLINKNISLSLRKYWIQVRAGIKISKKHYGLLLHEINSILEENNIDVSQAW